MARSAQMMFKSSGSLRDFDVSLRWLARRTLMFNSSGSLSTIDVQAQWLAPEK
jgi:hypothetical protein